MRTLPKSLLPPLIIILTVPVLYGQSMGTGTIRGIVTDPSDASVAGADVTAIHLSTNVSHTTTTNSQGNYVLPNQQIGSYEIRVQRSGFNGPLDITGNIFGYFNTAAFSLNPLGTFGNEGSNIVRGPGISDDVTFNLFKNFAISKDVHLRFGAAFFNVFNHANFDSVGSVFGSSTFGDITDALDPRHIQLNARLTF